MSARERLANRRQSETFSFECNALHYLDKAGSHSDSAAKDSAVVASIAQQHGVPVDVIRKALLRDPRGKASSPLGAALDIVAGGQAS